MKRRAASKAKGKRKTIYILAPFIVLVVIIVALELITRGFNVSRFVMPPPSEILLSTIEAFPFIAEHLLFTVKTILLGFVISVPLGIVLAALFSQSRILVNAMSPIILCLVITPMITIIPLIMLWLGTDPNLRILVIIVQATPIITFNTLNGFTHIEKEKLELGAAVGATKFQTFRKITFMNSMPQVFTGVKLGCIFSTIGAISADFVAGTIGMGTRILHYTKFNATDIAYGCILLVAIIGIVLYYIVEAVEKRIIKWKS